MHMKVYGSRHPLEVLDLPALELGAGKISAPPPLHSLSSHSHLKWCPHLQSGPSQAHPPHYIRDLH